MIKYFKILVILLIPTFGFSQTGPGGVLDATSATDNLVLWLDANVGVEGAAGDDCEDDDDVVIWHDQSGYDNDATPGNSPSYKAIGNLDEINGRPQIFFDGTNEYLSVADDASLNPDGITIFVVADLDGPNNAWESILMKSDDDNWDTGYGIGREKDKDKFFGVADNKYVYWDNFTEGTSYMLTLEHDNNAAGMNQPQFWGDGDFEDSNMGKGVINDAGSDLMIGASVCNGPVACEYIKGNVAEVIILNSPATEVQRIIIHNYLSAKYDVDCVDYNYYGEDETVDNHDYDVAGIGQATDGSSQTDSKGTGWVQINNASSLGNDDFLFWGHDGDDITSEETTDIPGGTTNRCSRDWSVSHRNDVGTVDLQFDCSDFIIGDPADLQLLISTDNDYSANGAAHTTGLSYDTTNHVVTFTGVDFTDNDHFTLGSSSNQNVFGGIYYSIANGDMNSIDSWAITRGGVDCNCAPSGGKSAIITTHTMDMQNDVYLRNLKVETGTLQWTTANDRLTLGNGGSLNVNAGGLLDGNGRSHSEIYLAGSTDKNVILQGVGDRIVDVERIYVTNTATTTFSGTGNLELNYLFGLYGDNATAVNSLTGLLTAGIIRFDSDNCTFTNAADAELILNDINLIATGSIFTNAGITTLNDDLRCGAVTGAFTVTNTGTMTVTDEINPNSTVSIINNSGTFTHSGDYNNATSLTVNNLNGAIWTSSATDHTDVTYDCDVATNTFILNKAGTQDVGVVAGGFYNLTIQGASGTKSPDGDITVLNDFSIGGGAIVDLSTSSANITVAGNFINNSSDAGGGLTGGSQAIILNGSALQTISGSATTVFNDLTITNTVTNSDGVRLSADIQVDGTLTMTMSNGGDFLLNGQNITIGTNGTVSGESSDDHIYGTTGSIIHIIDMSATTTLYDDIAGLGIAIQTGGSQVPASTTITRTHAVESVNGNTSILRAFDISTTNSGSLNANLRISYFDSELNGQPSSSVDMALWRYDGADWNWRGGTFTENGDYDQLTVRYINTFSKWTPSDTSTSPLPIELLSFSAEPENEEVNVSWTTATETNNDYFSIERSKDGINWELIVMVDGETRSQANLSYEYTDYNPYSGTSYYRISQTDLDGTSETFDPVAISMSDLEMKKILIFPNPTSADITIVGNSFQLKNITFYNQMGQNVTAQITLISKNDQRSIYDLSQLNEGIYFVRTNTSFHKIIKN
ncbi:MAG: T9SS type A sorting domain-containing protein [Flavobacteriales bacterium]|nr:T9SS type A sorting domain-containing protein [Flavobacteriales bacterium]